MSAAPAPRRRLRIAPILFGAMRVALGTLWLIEGVIKVRAGFDADDIGFVVDGAASNSRVSDVFAWFAQNVMGAAPGLFGFAIPAMDIVLGLALIAGLLPRLTTIGSLLTLTLFWSADLLIDQYPLMLVLSTGVLAWPAAAGRLGLQRWLEQLWSRLRRSRRAGAISAG